MYLLNKLLKSYGVSNVITTLLANSGFKYNLTNKTQNQFDNIPKAFSNVLLAQENL